jgi:PBP1b-binding outer membrane lipoprotein LpoB
MNKLISYILILIMTFTSCSSNETEATTPEERSEIAAYEADLVQYILEDSGEELALLLVGRDSCTDSELKANARQMLSDQQKMDNDFRAYAEKKRINLEGIDMNKKVSFQALKGNERDIEWAEKIKQTHEAMLERFTEAQEKDLEPELKKLLKDCAQHVDTHRIMAEKLIEKLTAQPAGKEYPPLTE